MSACNTGMFFWLTASTNYDARRKCIVVAYPLCDNVRPYSIGMSVKTLPICRNELLQYLP